METIGFIGVGMMGGAIASRMLEHGVPVLAYDNNPATLNALVEKGASRANSVKDVVDQAKIVFACLPTAEICKAVAFGDDGAIHGTRVKYYVETSTTGGEAIIEIAEKMASKGITVLDSPVIGGTMSVAAGTLGVLVGAPTAAFDRVKPVLESFAGKVFHLGENPGMGQVGKVVNNSVAYAVVLASCESVAVAMKAGLDIHTAIDIINSGSGANFFTQKVMPNFIAQGKFEGTGAIEIGLKDVKMFLSEAARLEAETPMARSVSALQKTIIESGPPGRDTMEIFHYFTDEAGLPRQG